VTNSPGDEVGILAMCCVPIASIENADHIVTNGWEGLEEADKAVLVVDLLL
jgi:hypothetical protein